MMTTVPETIEVRAAHRFDEARLVQFLKEQLEDFAGPLIVRQFAGGQSNPTFYLSAGDRQYVLRKKPPGHLLPSAHQVEREYRIITALAQTGVPVCRTYLLCEDTSVIGTAFYLMDYVPGRVFHNLLLPELEPAERTSIYDAMNEVLAKLHCIDYEALGLGDFGKPGNYYARQISRWSRQYEAAKTEEIEAMNRLMAWLPENIPPGDETTIVHGDYRLENMIFHPTEPRVLAVLDWELSTLGHPLGDLAYNCLPYHFAMYGGQGLLELDSASTGIPDEASYLAAYCRRTGRAGIEHWNFYLAFALFRSASIAQGVYARGLQGNASSETATQYGAVVRKMAERAWDLIEQANQT